MRYLLCAVLLFGVAGCDGGGGGNGGATAAKASEAKADARDHEHDHDHGHKHEGERVEHFEGEPAKDWEEAIAHLKAFNEKLEAKLEKDEITPDDMAKIHEWSYTMENAVGRLRTELEETAKHLEELHLGSERAETERIRKHGRKYLEGLAPLLED